MWKWTNKKVKVNKGKGESEQIERKVKKDKGESEQR